VTIRPKYLDFYQVEKKGNSLHLLLTNKIKEIFMDAIQFLINEHEKVRKTFKEISDKSHRFDTKQKMLDDLCDELLRHEKMEQTIWYPHFKNNPQLQPEVKHLIAEEKDANKMITKISHIKSEEEWEKAFLKFWKDVDHHASEEEKLLFPNVRKILNEAELEKIGKEMREFKLKYNAEVLDS